MDASTRQKIEGRIGEINRELGLAQATPPGSGAPVAELGLLEKEELYAERERLLQELERDC